ncbi:hypothetical protein IKG13_00165 [Candidatus Saccharibacteria bacterium]|nr:hypothetical protein [Candidatus Saccharibacteria bacterium]
MKKKINIKSKKTLVFALPALFLLSFGVSLAVSHDRATMANNFKLGGAYETLFVETFDSPQNWITCETIDKSLVVTNDTDSSGSISVRLKLEEQWIAADGTTVLPLVSAASGLTMAQIDFTPNSGWTKQGVYYYYDSDLAKNATTSSLITGVTLNCNANIDSVAGADSAYGDATYHLKITAQAINAESKSEWDKEFANMIAKKANPDSNIDFTQAANIATGNGNGVNRAIENGQDVYYFRGEVYDNNVIWADKCWKMVRTTATGGTKMIYNGEPTDVVVDGETVKQCNATGADSQITVNINGTDTNTFKFNNDSNSPADVGYMYGTRIEVSALSAGSTSFVFSNNVSRSDNTYTLDTSPGQSIAGTWEAERTNAAVKYHYFCTDGASVCDNTKIGYIHDFNGSYIYYLKVDGYNNIEDMKTAMFTNTTDSNAKTMIETWFEQQNLDGHIANTKNYEDDLEDTVFCNDRSYYSGALKGKDSDATPRGITGHSNHGAYIRNVEMNAQSNHEPSLDCINSNDAFTKDSANGNGKLDHKIGLITADELTMAGNSYSYFDSNAYLYTGQSTWSASPSRFGERAVEFYWYSDLLHFPVDDDAYGLRPLVSLKAGTKCASGTGTTADPYIVE